MTQIAFLRGLNVGGHTVKMDRLRSIFTAAGMERVATVIASGNVLFDSELPPPKLEALLAGRLHAELGYEVDTFVRTPTEIDAVLLHPPFPAHDLGEATLYICFLAHPPSERAAEEVEALSSQNHILRVHGRELYWLAHTSIARTDVDERALGRTLGGSMTMRNLRTVRRIAVAAAAREDGRAP